MSFSNYGNVRSIVDTDITNAEITNIITWVDAQIKLKISTTSVPTGLTSAEWNAFLEGLSARWAALVCMTKDPSAEKLGEYSGDRRDSLLLLERQVKEALKDGGGGIALTYHSERLPSLS